MDSILVLGDSPAPELWWRLVEEKPTEDEKKDEGSEKSKEELAGKDGTRVEAEQEVYGEEEGESDWSRWSDTKQEMPGQCGEILKEKEDVSGK